jgi:hypothetical protein
MTKTAQQHLEKQAASVAVRPAFCTIEDWLTISGMGRRSTYEALGSGGLRAIKRGSRTLIDVEHGLAWLRSLPAWQPQQRRRQKGPAAEASSK